MIKQPIGIFDSGVGGLTVFKEIRKAFPSEDIVYFGDTARVPYGPKSQNTIIDYSIQNARFLMQQNVKIIIVACNTASSVALEALQNQFAIPTIGVILPGAQAAIKQTRNSKIGIIGTDGTVKSNSYLKAIKGINAKIEVHSQACPLFVALAEEGWENHQVSQTIAEEYLKNLLKEEIDTLILGCTHFPILKKTIQRVVGKEINLIDSATAVVRQLQSFISNSDRKQTGKDYFFVSDNEEKFRKIASKILGKEVNLLEKVFLGETWYCKE